MNTGLKILLIGVGVVLLFPGACAALTLPMLLSGHYGAFEYVTWFAMAILGVLGVWLINKLSRS